MDELLEAIDRYQERNHLTDNQFSIQIGLVPSTISRIKSGQRQPGSRVLKAIAQIPELKDVCFDYITGNGHSSRVRRGRGNGNPIGRLISSIKSRIRDIPGHRPSSFLSSLGKRGENRPSPRK